MNYFLLITFSQKLDPIKQRQALSLVSKQRKASWPAGQCPCSLIKKTLKELSNNTKEEETKTQKENEAVNVIPLPNDFGKTILTPSTELSGVGKKEQTVGTKREPEVDTSGKRITPTKSQEDQTTGTKREPEVVDTSGKRITPTKSQEDQTTGTKREPEVDTSEKPITPTKRREDVGTKEQTKKTQGVATPLTPLQPDELDKNQTHYNIVPQIKTKKNILETKEEKNKNTDLGKIQPTDLLKKIVPETKKTTKAVQPQDQSTQNSAIVFAGVGLAGASLLTAAGIIYLWGRGFLPSQETLKIEEEFNRNQGEHDQTFVKLEQPED